MTVFIAGLRQVGKTWLAKEIVFTESRLLKILKESNLANKLRSAMPKAF